jgi:hypothetical protein
VGCGTIEAGGHIPRAADDSSEEVGMPEFWFNTKTREVEEGHKSDWTNLMGPYPTREAAANALATARANTERWDAEDRAWRGEDD